MVGGEASNWSEFVVFKFQPVSHVNAEGQQGDGDLGDDAGVVILNIGVVAADIRDGAEHKIPPFPFGTTAQWKPRASADRNPNRAA